MKLQWIFTIAALVALAVTVGPANAELIAHYTFDVDNGGTTPDSVGSAYATLGPKVGITTSTDSGPVKVGPGALVMTRWGGGDVGNGGDGAITSNSFSWANDARTVTFWWKCKSGTINNVNGQETFISFGSNAANGTRMDIKQSNPNTLRVEVQGTGYNSNPPIQDNNWHFIAVVIPNNATMADVKWYVDGSTTNLNGSTNSQDIATGTGPIAFGDSILNVTDQRGPNGYLDDVQFYDEVLDQDDLAYLYNNPGAIIGLDRPDVDAGDDWISWSGEPVTANATVVNNTADPVQPLTYQWTIDAASVADTNLDIILTDPDQEDVTVEITKLAPTGDATVVTMTLAANNAGSSNPDVIDTMTIDIYDNACDAGLASGLVVTDQTDLNGDCITGIEDLADLLSVWLDDYELTEPFVL